MLRVATATDPSCGRTEDKLAICEIPGGVAVVLADGDAANHVVCLARRAICTPEFDHFNASAWAGLLREIDRERLPGEASAVAMAVWQRHLWGASVGSCSAFVAHERGLDDLTENQMRRSRMGTGKARPVPFERAEWDGCVVVGSSDLLGKMGRGAMGRAVFQGDVDRAARRLVQRMRASQDERTADVAVATVCWTDR